MEALRKLRGTLPAAARRRCVAAPRCFGAGVGATDARGHRPRRHHTHYRLSQPGPHDRGAPLGRGQAQCAARGRDEPKGLTPDQAAKRIADRLKSGKYINDPQITVTVVQARSRLVSVLGFVNSPGRYELDGISAKISDVIAMAGGLDPNASDKIVLQPSGAGKSEPVIVDLSSIIQGDSSKNIDVRGGDSIFVPRAAVVYVYGEVQKGGAYRIEPDMTVMQAISLAGGITPRGSESRVQIRRKGSDGKWKQFSVKLTDVVSPDDVIYVREGLF